ncbi:MAG: methionyl-tRNA formyltransferase [Acidobacteriota bacterium]
MTLSVVFMGSPAFAADSLSALLDARISVPLIVTQPDRAVGRHTELRPTDVAALGAKSGIAVEKPERVRGNAALLERLRAAAPDAIAVVAFGKLLPREILDLPRLGCVNVHASLLPRYRGASPIQAAILAGDRETGVVTMRVEEELDAGPLYLKRRVVIGPHETAGELSERLAKLSGELLVETLRQLESGNAVARPQEGEPSFCRTIRREDGLVDWNLNAAAIARRLRAYTPWPGLYTFLGKERIKIGEVGEALAGGSGEPGELRLASGRLIVAAGESSALNLIRIQRSGRTPITGQEFARSVSFPARFGNSPG